LELKVKMMEEERERSLKEEAEKVDLKKDLGETTPLPENLAVSGDVSDDKENRSFNESNSTTQKGEGQARNGVVKDKARPEPERNEPNTGRIGSEPGNDSVMNGKVDNIDDAGTNEEKSVKKASRAGRPGELESVGESKREKEAASKQSSDVQSSASLSRKKRRRKGGGVGGSSSGEEPEGDEVSPATKRVSAVKSEPLIKLLGIIRSHRLGSVFERRLRSQVYSALTKLYILFDFQKFKNLNQFQKSYKMNGRDASQSLVDLLWTNHRVPYSDKLDVRGAFWKLEVDTSASI
jgi:hypothetical protein